MSRSRVRGNTLFREFHPHGVRLFFGDCVYAHVVCTVVQLMYNEIDYYNLSVIRRDKRLFRQLGIHVFQLSAKADV